MHIHSWGSINPKSLCTLKSSQMRAGGLTTEVPTGQNGGMPTRLPTRSTSLAASFHPCRSETVLALIRGIGADTAYPNHSRRIIHLRHIISCPRPIMVIRQAGRARWLGAGERERERERMERRRPSESRLPSRAARRRFFWLSGCGLLKVSGPRRLLHRGRGHRSWAGPHAHATFFIFLK